MTSTQKTEAMIAYETIQALADCAIALSASLAESGSALTFENDDQRDHEFRRCLDKARGALNAALAFDNGRMITPPRA